MSEARTALDRKGGIALWRQLALVLGDEIKSGTFKPKAKLPTEPHLARRFGVNRHTVRRALSELQEEHLVSIEQGRGTFVAQQLTPYQAGDGSHHAGDIGREGRDVGGELLNCEHLPATPKTAAALALRAGEEVILLELVHLVDHRPVSIASHYFPAHRFAGLEEKYHRTHSITETLRQFGIADYLQKQTRVSASLPTANDARLLKMPRGQPVVVAENVNVDMAGRPIEFTVSRSAGSRMQLGFDR